MTTGNRETSPLRDFHDGDEFIPAWGPADRVSAYILTAIGSELCVFEIVRKRQPRTAQSFYYQAIQDTLKSLALGMAATSTLSHPFGPEVTSRARVQDVVGPAGVDLVLDVCNLIRGIGKEKDWPLTDIDIRIQSDPEVPNTKVMLLVLKLKTDFDNANRILHKLYDHLQNFVDNLSESKREVFISKLYFDVQPV